MTDQRIYLDCPCCGSDGAVSDAHGEFVDGQRLICGCPGCVSVDSESEPFVSNGDEPCPQCEAAERAYAERTR